MAKGNDGNYLQHCIEAALAQKLVQAGPDRELHIAITHGMEPFEPFQIALDEPKPGLARKFIKRALKESSGPPRLDEAIIVKAYRKAGASEKNYPNSAELMRVLVGSKKLSGGITEIVGDKHRELEEAWRNSKVRTACASWRRDAENPSGALACPENLDRPWLFSMDPMTYVEKGCEDDNKLRRSDLGRIAGTLRPYVESGQPGAATLFVYNVNGQGSDPRRQFWKFIDSLAECVGATAGYFWLTHRGGNRNLAGLVYSGVDLSSGVFPPHLQAGKK